MLHLHGCVHQDLYGNVKETNTHRLTHTHIIVLFLQNVLQNYWHSYLI